MRVVLADDHEIVRKGIRAIVNGQVGDRVVIHAAKIKDKLVANEVHFGAATLHRSRTERQ